MGAVRLLLATLVVIGAAHSQARSNTREVKFIEPGEIKLQAKHGVPFSQNLKQLLTEPTQPNLVFSGVQVPSWLSLNTSTGLLQGNPPPKPGRTEFRITALRTDTEEADFRHLFSITIQVDPFWDTALLQLNAKEDVPFNFDLKLHVTDPAGSPFTFAATGLPSWMSLNPATGILSGTPRRADVGTFSVPSITAITSHGSVSVPAQGKVEKTVKPPKWKNNPITLPDANDAAAYAQALAGHADNPEGTPLVFVRVDGNAWIAVDDQGRLSGSPQKSDVGVSTVTVRLETFIDGTKYTDTTVFRIPVLHIKQPPQWTSPTVVLSAKEDVAFSFDLKSVATDPEAGTITFSATGLPAWLRLEPTGLLTGTPRRVDVGNFSGITFTATASGGSSTAAGQGTVAKTIHPPKWTGNPIALPNAKEEQLYDIDLTPFVTNPEGTTLTFSKKGGTVWPNITAVGRITGTPQTSDLGAASVTAHFTTVIDGQTFEDTTVLNFTVVHVPKPPKWTKDPLDLGPAQEDSPFQFDLKTVVTDPENGTLTFSATGLPPWLTMTPAGLLTGTPRRANVGIYSGIVFTATGVGGSSTVNAFGVVLKTIHPPKWKANPITLPDASEDVAYLQDVSGHVSNFEGTPITITKTLGPTWAVMGNTGLLSGTPRTADIGPVLITVKLSTVIDGQTFEDTTALVFKVKQTKFPPVWNTPNIDLGVQTEGTPFTFNLNSVVSNPMGGPMTFSATGLPPWMSIASDGRLSGTPGAAHVGPYSGIVFTATAQGGSTTAGGSGLVKRLVRPPKWISNPLALKDAHDGEAYNVALVPFVLNPENVPLTFQLLPSPLPPPAWLQVQSTTGNLFGTPAKTDLGNVFVNAKVSATIDGVLYEDVTQLQIKVIHLIIPPTFKITDIDLGFQDENVPFTFDLKTVVNNPDNDPLTFTALNLPDWMTLASNGVITGTPRRVDVGKYMGIIFKVVNSGGNATATGHGEVRKVIQPPKWTGNPIPLPDGKEATAYLQGIAGFITNPEGAAITLTKVNGPSWVALVGGSSLGGTPQAADVGPVEVQVKLSAVIDGKVFEDTTTFSFRVFPKAQPPVWQFADIDLGIQTEEVPFVFDLRDVAAEPQGADIIFTATGLPAWMSLTPEGILSGTPHRPDVGPYSGIVFTATSVNGSATARGHGEVKKQTKRPRWIASEIDIDDATEDLPYAKGLVDYVLNPEGLPLTFSIVPAPIPPAWINLQQTTGVLFGTPRAADVGPVRITVKFTTVVDGVTVEEPTELHFNVKGKPKPPAWLENPIHFTAIVDKPFDATLRNKVRDPAGRPVTFTMTGPSWLTLATGGSLGGTPRTANLGANSYDVKVCNDLPLCADAVMIVTVKEGTTDQIDVIDVDAPVAGARVENLWVVGNSTHGQCLAKSLKTHIGVYYDELRRASVVHNAVMLGANGKDDGEPVRRNTAGPMLMLSTQADWVVDFQERVGNAFIGGLFTKKLHTPLWSMHRFYERVPSMSEIYHRGYMEPTIPMEGMIVASVRDHFKCFTKSTPQESWDARDFARSFIDFHKREKKPYRVSAITPKCLAFREDGRCARWADLMTALEDEGRCGDFRDEAEEDATDDAADDFVEQRCGGSSSAADSSYQTVVQETGGKRYEVESSGAGVDNALRDYAKEVIFRAVVHAKRKIKLSKTPSQPLQMQVAIADVILAGNSGAETDKWRYLAATNEVEIFWERIDDIVVGPGDKIKITYKAGGARPRFVH